MLVNRPIVVIDSEKCTGCGDCILVCAEGAIELVDGKARLVGENLCDGFGVCLGKCPEDAIIIEEREAEVFDEEAVKEHLAALWIRGDDSKIEIPMIKQEGTPAGCPSSQTMEFRRPGDAPSLPTNGPPASGPVLTHWPIKLNLVPPGASFLQGADVVLMADCVPFACGDLYRQFVSEHALLIGCPKFDNPDFALTRLTDIFRNSDVRSLTVVHMEVPCCTGYWHLSKQALAASGKTIPVKQVVISVSGQQITQTDGVSA